MKVILKITIAAIVVISWLTSHAALPPDPLPSWKDGPTKNSILNFVEDVTNKGSPNFVAPEDRIATFDNDGTMWVEQPIYTQVIFSFEQVKVLAKQHPEWKKQKPFSVILSGDKKAIASLSAKDIEFIIAVTSSNIPVDTFIKTVKDWLAHTKNPHFDHYYTELIYQPMLEAMQFLRDNGFKIYIVTGGGQDFVRAFAQSTYGVMPEQVIGTTSKTRYTFQNNKPDLIKLPEILFIDDKTGKPEAINLFIGRKPNISFGNSDGDRQMLEWTQSGDGKRLMLLVHHDDAKREFAYGPESKVGTFSDSLMQEAQKNNWRIISMKNDWKIIFPFEKKETSEK